MTAVKFYRSNNPVLHREGRNRLVGILASNTIAPAMMWASMSAFGVSWKDEQKFRSLLAPWEQYNTRVYGPLVNGKRIYMNMNYVEPQGDLGRAAMALISPNKDGPLGNASDFVYESIRPLLNLGLIPGALTDVQRNQTEYGAQVYNPEDAIQYRWGDSLKYLWNRYSGGTLGRMERKLPMLGRVTASGTVYDPYIILGNEALGLDLNEISIPDRFRSTLYTSQAEFRNAQRIFNSPIQRTGNEMTDQMLRALYGRQEQARRTVFKQLRDKIEAARNGGMSTRDIKSALKERQYSSKLIDDLLTGRYFPYTPGKGVLKRAADVGNHIPPSFFSSKAKSYEEEEEE